MKKRGSIKTAAILLCLTLAFQPAIFAQEPMSLTLEDAVSLALQNNHLLNAKKLQIEEKRQKVNEDRIKYLPNVTLGALYQYNSNLPGLTITRGQFGQLPLGGLLIPLPSVDEEIRMGNHNIYNAGVTLYQPVSQIGKISAGVKVSATDLQITRTEETKAERQIRLSVEKLYYGLLVIQKQIEEEEIKVALAKAKFNDAESALAAGKTTESSRYGLAASVADEEQVLLRLKMQNDDYSSDLKQITGISPEKELIPELVSSDDIILQVAPIDTSLLIAEKKNSEIRLASLFSTKAGYSIKASQYSYLPDIGLMGGYAYQKGTIIYPKNNAFIGASFKWNLQDVVSNRTIQLQRLYTKRQADENLANTREQVTRDIAKAYRKLKQSEELINVASKAVSYRKEDLRIQTDRRNSGLSLETDLLAARAALAKAESDYYAARIGYRIALSELEVLTGNY